MNQSSTGTRIRPCKKKQNGSRNGPPTEPRSARAGEWADPETGLLLDTSTKSASTPINTGFLNNPEKIDPETGEIIPAWNPLLKWELKGIAMLALGVFDSSTPYHQRHRIRICSRHRRPDVAAIEVRGDRNRYPYFAGFQMCGSVWVCPVCAAKIQEYRAQELRKHYLDAWTKQGGTVLMIGPTVPHTRADALEPLLRGYTDALRRFNTGRAMHRLRDELGFAGAIRALEVTWGDSGWHPHAHVLWFIREEIALDELQHEAFKLWEAAANRAGFTGLSARAFSVQDGSGVRSYLSKMGREYGWGTERELVKSHTKKAAGGRMSPFDLLRANLDESKPELLARFREYAEAFHGRRQLYKSPSLKDIFQVEERTDEQIAESLNELDQVLALIDPLDLPMVRRYNLQGEILETVHRYGGEGLQHLLDHYRNFWKDQARVKPWFLA